MQNRVSDYLPQVVDLLTLAGSLGSFVTAIVFSYGALTTYFLWRSRRQRNKFTRVYFPSSREDFYEYYVNQIKKAKQCIYITSDGFNMHDSQSRRAATRMNKAQSTAITRGATVFRYQITATMHLNWIYEIIRMKRAHGSYYRTFVNFKYEGIGNFAVIDPGSRHAVTEFMLPDIGSLAQATVARDYGFIHGHQGKADQVQEVFSRIMNDRETIELTEENAEDLWKLLFDRRMHLYRSDNDFHVFDEEILKGIKTYGRDITYEQVKSVCQS